MSFSQLFDILIIGGGPAGLAAASALARQCHTVAIFDSGKYRNDGTSHMHTIPTWDSKSPEEVRTSARKELLSSYDSAAYFETEIKEITEQEDGKTFKVTAKDGHRSWIGRKVILATGARDIYPEIEGYAECWPASIFHCLLCQGYEERGCASAGVLALNDLAMPPFTLMVSRQILQLAKSATIYTNGPNDSLTAAIQETVSSETRFKLDTRRIKKLEKGKNAADVILHFEDGSTAFEGFLAHHPPTRANGPFAEQLGLELTEQGDIKVFGPFNQTSQRGVFAGGDAGAPMKTLANALTSGGFAAAGAMMQVQADKLGQPSMF